MSRVRDDFTRRSEYWRWRTDGTAGFEISGSVLRMWMGPTEALYYSNAEISDGEFNELRWVSGAFRIRARISGDHYGSAGFGFWNHSMRVDESFPAWFIYLRAYGPYPFKGFFMQLGNVFYPVRLESSITTYKVALTIFPFAAPVRIASSRPVKQDLKLSEWNVYEVRWAGNEATFLINDELLARLRTKMKVPKACRADAWIDNAVFQPRRGDAGRVFRHVTQENRRRAYLEIDWIEVEGEEAGPQRRGKTFSD